MCTLTVITDASPRSDEPPTSIRIAFNRDEQRTREIAGPPAVHELETGRAVWPIDPPSGGTWIAVNDNGLAAALLNTNAPSNTRLAEPTSRGTIIPNLMTCGCAREAEESALQLSADRYDAFRLVLVDSQMVVVVRAGGGAEITSDRLAIAEAPIMLTSSGLGDHLVQAPRRELFDQMFGRSKQTPWEDRIAVQERFHRHSWPDRKHLSVCMSRPDARTVSYCVILLTADRVEMTYHGDSPDTPVPPTKLSLPRC